MKTSFATLAVALGLFAASVSLAGAKQIQQSHTDVEQTLCQPDVFRLCNDAVPDEERIIACMKANRTSLSPDCRKVFEAGMKKRGM